MTHGRPLPDLTAHPAGWAALIVFAIAYAAVMVEEITRLRKSKPVLIAAGLIWIMIAWAGSRGGFSGAVREAARANFLEFSEIFLFLLVAMTYVNANIAERVGRVFPFLRLDSDPFMVVAADGRLVWMYDAYTVSDRYSYAQPVAGGVNYIRNSVKITVDAYDGSLKFYLADPADPIAKTIGKVFPRVLRPMAEMPEDLRRHIRYPLDIFSVQTAVYSTYHMEDPQSFYNREDQWEIPVMGAEGQRAAMESYYTIMKLPGEKKEEFILMLPFNPKKKDNLSAWMAARSDGDAYGKMVVYRFPKDRLVYGPKQIVARINQDTEISRQVSLWDQRGSQVMQGTLLVIPVENSLIYVQPLYLRAETGKIPELKRVIVAYENKIAMEETLERALARIFGGGAGAAPGAAAGPAAAATRQPAADGSLADRAREHYERALRAQRDGNWALYGEEIGKLGEILGKMR